MAFSRKRYIGPKFTDFDEIICTYTQNRILRKKFKVSSPLENSVQHCLEVAGTFVTTDNPRLQHIGTTHVEGGWPRDINRLDEEQTSRYRKKQEKDESYLNQMKGLIKACEHAIFQNNAINLYETYFDDLVEIADNLKEDYFSKTVNVYRDHSSRGVTKIAWAPENPFHFASCYWHLQTYGNYQNGEVNNTLVWDIEYPNTGPLITLKAHASSPCLEYNPKDSTCLVTGMVTGQIAVFDIRSKNERPSILSPREKSHHDRINAIAFYCSKTNMEFMSGSSAGEIYWWDLRKMDLPTETLLLDPLEMNNNSEGKGTKKAFGVNVLEYESTIPNKYLVGVENGVVFTCNKKFKTPADRIYAKVQCHYGSIFAVQRNPSFLKFYLTVGDWQAKIWCEELKDSPVIWTKEYQSCLIHGCWSAVRCSSFYLSRRDGIMDAWDIAQRSDSPVLSTKLSDSPILCLSPHKEGKWVAAGSKSGDVYLVQVSDNLATSTLNDRPAMAIVLDRETRREKLLENKLKELKLKEKEKEREKMRIKLGLANPEEIEMNLANELAKQSEINFHQQIETLKNI